MLDPRRITPQGVFTRESWPSRLLEKPRPLFGRPATQRLRCDVLVIGSGAGGAVIAAEMAEAGLDVIVVEEGRYFRTQDFTAEAGDMLRQLYRDGGASVTLGTPPIIFTEGRCVGGSTVINGGMTWRTPERILDRWRREHQNPDISADDLAPLFERVEHFISAAYQDPDSIGLDNAMLHDGAQAMGWEVIPNIRNQFHCAGTNNCAFGCPTGAKRSTLLTYLPRALHFGARLFSDLRVTHLTTRGRRITGAEARVVLPDRSSGGLVHIEANHTYVCCGAIHTPALLQRSGVQSLSRAIGKNLTLHPNSKVVALFDQDVFGWQGVHQAYQVREFRDEGFLMAAVNVPPGILAMALPSWGREMDRILGQYNRIISAGILVEDTVSGQVKAGPGGVPLTLYEVSDFDAEKLVRGTALLCELLFSMGAREIVLPFGDMPNLRSPDDVQRLYQRKIPKAHMELMTVHMMGTCAMGGDPTRHVCDPWGKVYNTEGLSVADASLFPGPVGVNPMETIMTLATRVALHDLTHRTPTHTRTL